MLSNNTGLHCQRGALYMLNHHLETYESTQQNIDNIMKSVKAQGNNNG